MLLRMNTPIVSVASSLGGSVSFGRFLSESLDWGKWSSFCQKRHLEEIEKYSTPGSVAKKKAYFEAHYRKSAVRKSASLEQGNAIRSSTTVPETEGNSREGDDDEKHSNSIPMNPGYEEYKSGAVVINEIEVETQPEDVDFLSSVEPNIDKESYGLEKQKMKRFSSIIEDRVLADSPLRSGLPEKAVDIEDQKMLAEMEKQPLKESSVNNQDNGNAVEQGTRIPVFHKSSRPPSYPASKHLSTAKPVSSIHCMKENKSISSSKNGWVGSNEKEKSTPRSLHMSINFTQSQTRSTAPLINKTLPIIKKVEELKVVGSSSKACQDHFHRTKTVTRASSNGAPKLGSLGPQSELGRTPTGETISQRKKVDAKLNTFSVDSYLKSSSNKGSRSQTETGSPSEISKTAGRIEKLKKFFHNHNDEVVRNEARKLQEIPMVDAESEIRKLRKSLCFKARPLPDFYRKIEAPKYEVKKMISEIQPLSPKLGRKSNTKANSSCPESLLPPLRHSSSKNDQSIWSMENSSRKSSNSIALFPNKQKLNTVSSPNK